MVFLIMIFLLLNLFFFLIYFKLKLTYHVLLVSGACVGIPHVYTPPSQPRAEISGAKSEPREQLSPRN